MRTIAARLGGFAAALALAATAHANPEPTGYSARSVGMGLTGLGFLDTPAAVVWNPANLEGTGRFALELGNQMLLVRSWAPIAGPEAHDRSELGLGPLGSLFAACRVHERVVLGAGVYILAGYGSRSTRVDVVNGEPVADPQDLDVMFFNAEGAIALSVHALEGLDLGFSLRLPYSRLDATVYQEIFPGIHSWVEQRVSGIGYPAGLFGITYTLRPELTLAFVYRTKSRNPMEGTTDPGLSPALVAVLPELASIPTETDWHNPHMLHFGVSSRLLDERLLVAIEYRLQFHGETNREQIFELRVSEPALLGGETTIRAPFLWQLVHSGRFGGEYRVSELLAARLGYNLGRSATPPEGAQYFAPPPGLAMSVYTGLGFHVGSVDVDLAGGVTWGDHDVPPMEGYCEPGQRVKTGCPGEYRVRTGWAGLSLIYELPSGRASSCSGRAQGPEGARRGRKRSTSSTRIAASPL